MSEPYLPEPDPVDAPRRPWLCPHDHVILQNVRPSGDSEWLGYCGEHGWVFGIQLSDSQMSENLEPEEENDGYDEG